MEKLLIPPSLCFIEIYGVGTGSCLMGLVDGFTYVHYVLVHMVPSQTRLHNVIHNESAHLATEMIYQARRAAEDLQALY